MFSMLEADFPRKDTACPPQLCVQGLLETEQLELALPLADCKKSGFAQKTIGFSGHRRFGLIQQEERVWKREQKRMACPKGKIKLLCNTPQGEVSLAEQPWLQNYSKSAMVGDAGHIMNPTPAPLSNTIPIPLSRSLGLRYGSSLNTKFCISPRQDNEIQLFCPPSLQAADT